MAPPCQPLVEWRQVVGFSDAEPDRNPPPTLCHSTWRRRWTREPAGDVDEIRDVGRNPGTGGYRRFVWNDADQQLREWFAGEAKRRGLDLHVDRNGNQWAWWGDPAAGDALVLGSHLDSVPEGGAFDGPLGVLSAFAAVDAVREQGLQPAVRSRW